MKILAILQARMTSTRLPGKILKPVLGKPLLHYELERLRRCPSITQLIVATTTNFQDDPVAALCEAEDLACYRGSEHDVLGRFYQAALPYQPDAILRVTGDCPLLDPQVVEGILHAYMNEGSVDYVSNSLERTFPRGLDAEVFSFWALEAAHREATDPIEREHVTPFLYRNPERFRLKQHKQSPNLSHHRWTVDTPEDFELIANILSSIYLANPDFTQADVLALLEKRPDWLAINAHIEQIKVR